MDKNIKILQINIQSIRPTDKREELEFFLNTEDIKIAYLQEIWLKEGESFRMRGYTLVSKRRAEGYGGVRILIKDGLDFEPLNIRRFLPLETIAVKITNLDQPLIVISVYAPPDTSITKQVENKLTEFFETVETISEEMIVAGDFNAHHAMWDESRRE
ncbi:hypothetical protein RP20_CCG019920 [Aedes albopictus]|nr:hypothetical protein RP20_CCG019920 [Aedes albopictus]